jgi:cellulose biosynthesis protein BcsQ
MVQKRNKLHRDTMDELTAAYPRFLKTTIPLSVDVEKMGLRRMPLLAYSRACDAAQAYRELCSEIISL